MTFEQLFYERSARRILSEVNSDRDLMSAQLGESPSELPSEI